jgi:ribosomal protein S18 acetylase RimI-like enzyme
MEMYKAYLEELHDGKSIVSTDYGFASYWIREKECYIEDIYTKPEYRKAEYASKLADLIAQIAIEQKCKYLTGSVIPTANNSTKSLKVLLGYGFKLCLAEENLIWFKKDL